jgi:hypothetical protein
LLSEPWSRESLLAFLNPLPVDQWFNRAAPRIKSGEVVPEALDADDALALLEMGADPSIQTQDDFTALDMAASLPCLQLLREATRIRA